LHPWEGEIFFLKLQTKTKAVKFSLLSSQERSIHYNPNELRLRLSFCTMHDSARSVKLCDKTMQLCASTVPVLGQSLLWLFSNTCIGQLAT
jgi:hypothetical protein